MRPIMLKANDKHASPGCYSWRSWSNISNWDPTDDRGDFFFLEPVDKCVDEYLD